MVISGSEQKQSAESKDSFMLESNKQKINKDLGSNMFEMSNQASVVEDSKHNSAEESKLNNSAIDNSNADNSPKSLYEKLQL